MSREHARRAVMRAAWGKTATTDQVHDDRAGVFDNNHQRRNKGASPAHIAETIKGLRNIIKV